MDEEGESKKLIIIDDAKCQYRTPNAHAKNDQYFSDSDSDDDSSIKYVGGRDKGKTKQEPEETVAPVPKEPEAEPEAEPAAPSGALIDNAVRTVVGALLAQQSKSGGGKAEPIDQDALNGMIDARLDAVLEDKVRAIMGKVFSGK